MSEPSVEAYLNQELGEASTDSSGTFTLSPAETLRKLADFQLPGKQTWAVKVVQAAVAGGPSKISLRLMQREAVFTLSGPLSWDIAELERGFHNPEPGPDRSLWHLRQGLWNVGLRGRRPFWLQAAGWKQRLVWNGQALAREEAKPLNSTVLSVRHLNREEKTGLAYLLSSDTATHNAEILQEMVTRCFTCPVPLDVDALRLDALQSCPDQGSASSSFLLQIGFAELDLPALTTPPHTFAGLEAGHELPAQASLFLLLTAHLLKRAGEHGFSVARQPSQVYWVLDGVVVESQALSLASRACSCALIASAEGLGLDVSGFGLLHTAAYRERLRRLYLGSNPFIQAGRADFTEQLLRQRVQDRKVSATVLAVGVGLLWVAPPFGVMALGLCAAGFLLGQPSEAFTAPQAELKELQQEWQAKASA
ncbi:hypothetical protein JST97_36745 [bacterium]|nr:hypothetical protein [bacterium]